MTPSTTHPAESAAPLMAPAAGSRRAEIALAAADEFTRRGYHSTRVEHIAERLSVTPGALYRHVPGKYEMFRDAVAMLVTALETASEAVSAPAPAPIAPASATPPSLEDMVEAITRTTLVHRTRSALYRWQGRYLTPEDRAAVTEVDVRVRRRLADAVLRRRQRHHGERPPGASSTAASSDVAAAGAGSAAAAILSCIASLGHHRIELSDDDAVALMTSIADLLALAAVAPTARPLAITAHTGSTTVRLRGGAATREGAIEAAIARFHSSGYDSVTMEAIGADVGVAASALYRHFSGKPALLTAAVDRTGTLVEGLLDSHAALHSSGTDPAVALEAMLWQYVGIAFSHGPDLMLYHSELGSLDPEDRRRLRQAQRRQLDRWAGLVLASAAEADGSIARIRVHAALAVVLDGGQGTGFDPAAAGRFGQLAGLILLPRR